MLENREYLQGDYENFIGKINWENMQKLFTVNFGGWCEKVSRKRFFELLNNGYTQIFTFNSNVVGYIAYQRESNHDSSIVISDIQIKNNFQRLGYGSQMLNYIENHCRLLNVKRMKLLVFKDNPAIYFYLKKGFVTQKYISQSNTYVMIRNL